MTPGSDGRSDLWIFGYGSLVWRPAFAHTESHPALIRGFRRGFWQGSTDHRGIPGAPGRVVTVLPEADSTCFGRLFRVEPGAQAAVLAGLDHREKGGYERFEVEARIPGSAVRSVRALMYAATPENPDYLGAAPLAEIASQVCASRGPSGPNIEYVFELASALRSMAAEDDHVFEVERLVRAERDRAA